MRPLKKALKYFSRIFSNLGGFVAAVVMFTVYVVQLAGMLALFPLLFALSRRATQAKPLFRKLYQSKTPPPEVGDDKLAQVVEEHAGLLFELIPSSNTSLYCKNHWIRKHYAPLVEEFNYRFPDHPHRLSVDDVIFFKSRLASFHKLFEHYDIIHAYATDPIFPMLIGTKPYVAYEHGTIREIPFENTIVGKLTLLAYARANAILLTNADNLPKARFIQADHSRIVNGYHRFDERKILAQLEQIRHYSREAGRFGIAEDIKVFFAPARQDHPVKGNDKILVAAAQVNQKYPGSFKVVFAQWGRHIEKAKAMIAELGLEDVVVWVDPLGSKDLMNSYRSVDAVLDQFVLPCIGGLPIDVMVVGEAPVISYLDDDLMGEFYGQTIPLFNCHEAQDIARAMETVITRPDQAQEVIEACKQWVRHYHTHQNVVQKLVEAYQLTGVV
jgi:glycosyltransferase involved in cell wall biosynthesis